MEGWLITLGFLASPPVAGVLSYLGSFSIGTGVLVFDSVEI